MTEGANGLLEIDFYTKDVCPLCEEVHALLLMMQNDYEFQIHEQNIYQNDALLEKYQLLIPAVQIGETFLNCEEISYETLEKTIHEASNKS